MADRRPNNTGATAARGADASNSSVWPWIIAALIVAALVIGAVWLVAADGDDDGAGTDDPTTSVAEGEAPAVGDDEVLEEGVEGESGDGGGLGDVDGDDG